MAGGGKVHMASDTPTWNLRILAEIGHCWNKTGHYYSRRASASDQTPRTLRCSLKKDGSPELPDLNQPAPVLVRGIKRRPWRFIPFASGRSFLAARGSKAGCQKRRIQMKEAAN